MADSESRQNSIEAIMRGLEMPAGMERQFEEIDHGTWNEFVQSMQERQESLESYGDNGTVGWQDLQRFQTRFNELDPGYVDGARRFGLVDIAFDGFIVERIDEFGRESVETKSPINVPPLEVVKSARCNIEVYGFHTGIGEISGTLLCLKLLDICSNDIERFEEYIECDGTGLYIPAVSLAEISH